MKKIFSLALLVLFAVALTSCNSCNRQKPVLGAKVTVAVKNIFGSPQDGMKVYMFKGVKPTNSTDPSTADKVELTNLEGVATFNLNFTDLKITEGETTVYFAVFYHTGDKTMVAGKEGIMLSNGDARKIEITIPI